MDYQYIKNTVFKTVEFQFDKEIEFYEFDGIRVSYDGTNAKIGAATPAAIARGCFLLAMHISEGKTEIDIEEHAHFKDCGVMLDCSRCGVMKVEALKRYIDCMASLGMNMLLLYTEDTYEIEGRPFFGYMRGRYTKEELREIVAYGETMGVELIPCIQTLGHMYQYLKWANAGGPDYTGEEIGKMRDTSEILLCEADATYRFIEDAIKACREAYNTKRIHIGMDEAGGIGTGAYLRKHGLQNKFEILQKHLNVVGKICEKYDFKPMIWSDMYFRIATGGAYYKYNFEFPKEVKNQVTDAQLVYWDYYSDDKKRYDGMLKKHWELTNDVAFAGAIFTCYGFLVTHDYSYMCSMAAMKSCLENGVQTVMATLWGDDGNEANHFFANSLLPIFSEHCYKGESCTEEDIQKASAYLTKIAFEDARAMGQFGFTCVDEYLKEWHAANGGMDMMHGKRLFYGDIMYDLSVRQTSCDEIMRIYNESAERMAELEAKQDKNKDNYHYAYLLYRIGAMKAELVKNLRLEYQKGNRKYLKKVHDEYLPQLVEWYEEFAQCHKKQWHRDYKPFGFEVLSFRYGGLIGRLKDNMDTIDQYLNNEISSIDELNEKVVFVEETRYVKAMSVTSPYLYG